MSETAETERNSRSSKRPSSGLDYGALLLASGAIGAAFIAGSVVQTYTPAARAHAEPPTRFADRNGSVHGATGDDSATHATGGNAAPAATFDSVYSLIKEHYVDALPSDRELTAGALDSLLASLNDPSATYLDADASRVFDDESRGHYGGIGAGLYVQSFDRDGYTDHKIVVVSALPGSPAEKAGLRPHDVITHVDGKWVLGSDPYLKVNRLVQRLQDEKKNTDTNEVQHENDLARDRDNSGIGLFKAQMLLRGDAGISREYRLPTDNIKLTVSRPGLATELTVSLTPATVDIDKISTKSIGAHSTTIRIPAFTANTADQVEAALRTAAGSGIVVDLRGNSGGVGSGAASLDDAARVAALFKPISGRTANFMQIRRTRGRTDGVALEPSIDATPTTGRVIVLVDGGTALAAEALAAYLRDGVGATLFGGKTFGDATMQTLCTLPDKKTGFTLVTGTLVGPTAARWANVGLIPTTPIAAQMTDVDVYARAAAMLDVAKVAASPLSHGAGHASLTGIDAR